MTVRVLIADDHGVVRQRLRMYLGLDPEIEVAGEASDGEEALRMVRELVPDVVLMDLLMPKMDGIAATRAIRSELPEVEIIALTSILDDGCPGNFPHAPAQARTRPPPRRSRRPALRPRSPVHQQVFVGYGLFRAARLPGPGFGRAQLRLPAGTRTR